MRVVDFLRRLATRDVEGGSLNLARSTLRLNRVRIDIQELEQFSEFAPIFTEFINEDHLVTVIAFPSFVNCWSVDRQAIPLVIWDESQTSGQINNELLPGLVDE